MNECPLSKSKTATIQAGPSIEIKFDENSEPEQEPVVNMGSIEILGKLTTTEDNGNLADRQPYVPTEINSLKISALVDTGATRSYMNRITTYLYMTQQILIRLF